jgi:hypothetical protein
MKDNEDKTARELAYGIGHTLGYRTFTLSLKRSAVQTMRK